jgi:hypothetical protein
VFNDGSSINNEPMTGLTFLEMPGDNYPSAMLPAGTFNYFDNDPSSPFKSPGSVGMAYDYIMNVRTAWGLPMTMYLPGSGYVPVSRYVYPITLTSDQLCMSPPSDRRFVMATEDFDLLPDASVKFAMAFVVTDTLGYRCPISSFKPITDMADTAWEIYYHPLPLSVPDVPAAVFAKLKIYPNPATDQLYIAVPDMALAAQLKVTVYDATGRQISVPQVRNGATLTLHVASLAAGIYTLHCSNGTAMHTELFMKGK